MIEDDDISDEDEDDHDDVCTIILVDAYVTSFPFLLR